MESNEKVPCRTPTQGRDGVTSIPRWKFDIVRTAILETVKSAGSDGAAFSNLPAAVGAQLSSDEREKLGSLGWHVTTVKLELEVRGEIVRLPGSPQRLILSA